jgi:hypothetical protein
LYVAASRAHTPKLRPVSVVLTHRFNLQMQNEVVDASSKPIHYRDFLTGEAAAHVRQASAGNELAAPPFTNVRC